MRWEQSWYCPVESTFRTICFSSPSRPINLTPTYIYKRNDHTKLIIITTLKVPKLVLSFLAYQNCSFPRMLRNFEEIEQWSFKDYALGEPSQLHGLACHIHYLSQNIIRILLIFVIVIISIHYCHYWASFTWHNKQDHYELHGPRKWLWTHIIRFHKHD